MPSYPDSTGGLVHFVKDMMEIEKKGDQQTLGVYERSLALPYAERWFKSVFGDDLGERLTVLSTATRVDAEVHTGEMLANQIAEKHNDIEAVRFDDSCNTRATPTEYPFLLLRQKNEHLYDVRFIGHSDASIWAYLAYVNGGFRFIGNLQKAEIGGPDPGPTGGSAKIKLDPGVVAARAISRVQPDYPTQALELGLQGTVILHALIGTDGSVQSLYLNEGQCILSEAAIEAVKQWRYSPTLINGNPVRVDTTIKVVFTLGPPR
ncbi:MAG: energy transducer TonB [Candidatus Acidiferrales bacterium]